MLNKVSLIGRLGKRPEVITPSSGLKITTFSLATTESWRDKQGNFQEETTWHNVTVLGPLGAWAASLERGTLVYLEGKIRVEEYMKNGEKRTAVKIVANFLKKLALPANREAHGAKMDDNEQYGGL